MANRFAQVIERRIDKWEGVSLLSGKEWAEKWMQDHPEILWLADANVRKTEEGKACQQGLYSEQLFGKKFIEFDRTLIV